MTATEPTAPFLLTPHHGHSPGCSCTGCAIRRGILVEPYDGMRRVAWSEWLGENDGSVRCETCKGMKGKINPNGGYREFSGPYETWDKCHACSGTGERPNNFAERANLIRDGVELERMGRGPFVGCGSYGVNMRPGERCVRCGNCRRFSDLSTAVTQGIAFDRTAGWWEIERLEPPRIIGEELRWFWRPITPLERLNDEDFRDSEAFISGTVCRGDIDALTLPAAAATDELLRAVFARHPCVSVVLSDVSDHLSIDQVRDNLGCFWRVDTLPFRLWKLVATGSPGSMIANVFPTRDAALASLSAAVVRHGRNLAGLPPLRS